MKKTVLITGAARGIGRAIAKVFAENGYNVLLNYNSSEKMAGNIITNLKDSGYSVLGYKADVSNREEVNDMIAYCLKEFGSIDVVINNAGIVNTNLFTEISNKDWEKVLRINLDGMFNVTQESLKRYM
ncbi:MAG: SDR family NAD(P)-dependent oxidoreductase, partial [Clostridia bacterium]|nr:SDR family NAD(P)-dependent oxidoreductase [Clostridia bacterium]